VGKEGATLLPEENSGYIAGVDKQELVFDAGSTLFNMDWSN
jgi:hypothetical protein